MAGLIAALIGDAYRGDSLAALGVPDPGKATTWGVPLVRGIGTILACLGIGSFLMSASARLPARTATWTSTASGRPAPEPGRCSPGPSAPCC